MTVLVKKFRALSIGALGSIVIAVGQVMTGALTWEAAVPLVIGALIHPVVSPAEHVGYSTSVEEDGAVDLVGLGVLIFFVALAIVLLGRAGYL